MFEKYTKFHMRVKQAKALRRTTVSIESTIAELLALRLGQSLDTADGHKAVRELIR
ncbi:MAG: hypothetical protein NTX25_22210 [Proteobacteria bacterium]|nr:hypothetical protein [Pseudomonadota bacterium]